MAGKTTLNAKNLEALGVERLAELLIEISTGSAASKRRLRLELAGRRGSDELAHEVRKRLASIARSRTFINWRRVKAVRTDLETQRKTIVEVIAADNPRQAYELIWQLLELASSVLQRTSGTGASLVEIFHQACLDVGPISVLTKVDADILAERAFKAIQANNVGQYDRLIDGVRPALGNAGMHSLKTMLFTWRDEPAEENAPSTSRNTSAVTREEEVASHRRQLAARTALQQIADAEGDVEAYIHEIPTETRSRQTVASDIARRLLEAGRPDEALATLDTADLGAGPDPILEWQSVRLEVLEALGRREEAQSCRWMWFEHSLQVLHLRAFLRRLADFDDVEAEEKAFRAARQFPDIHRALVFFIAWPALAEAARLVINRRQELDGDDYELLSNVVDVLIAKYPLSATILLRTMIDDTLDQAKSSRYKHAARHLTECASLGGHLRDSDGLGSHQNYVATLRQRHGKRHGFWKHVQV